MKTLRGFTVTALLAVVAAAAALLSEPPAAHAADFFAVPGVIEGQSPDTLGAWSVHYERVGGGDPGIAETINGHIDDKANELVQKATWDGFTRRPWTFDANGTVRFTTAVSEIFVTQYDTAEPHMPMQSVAGLVLDPRTGNRITWDNLFVDKTAGLLALGNATETAVASVAAPEAVRDFKRRSEFAPIDINFPAWVPTPAGIELHFPEFQFGRGLKVITVPWARVADQVRPEFATLMR